MKIISIDMIIKKIKVFCNIFVISIILLSGCAGFSYIPNKENESYGKLVSPTTDITAQYSCVSKNNPREIAFVLKIIDGDSILVNRDGQRIEVRYIGINAPEMYGSDEIAARVSTATNRELVEGKTITMVKDIRDVDKYGRLLRFVFVDNFFVNAELIKRGCVVIYDYTPDISCQNYFRSLIK